MRAILTALQEGRLLELPDNGKPRSLTFLARIIDANPDIEVGTDTIEEIHRREGECNTGIGLGVAVPHIRARREDGELFCAIGWCATGIDYGSPDGVPVHLVLMYYVPGGQKNIYLKEVSSLAKAVRKMGGIEPFAKATDLSVVRNLLLDWIAATSAESGPDATARMIRLDLRQSQAEPSSGATAAPMPSAAGANSAPSGAGLANVTSFSVVVSPPATAIVLSHDAVWGAALDAIPNLGELLASGRPFVLSGRQIHVTGTARYPSGRSVHYCVAIGR